MKNKNVANDFINNNCLTKTKHLFIEKNHNGLKILYSYGYHYPLSIILNDNTILINSDSYSNTTARHKGLLSNALGFKNFKDLLSNKPNNILIFSTYELKNILNNNLLTKEQLTEVKI